MLVGECLEELRGGEWCVGSNEGRESKESKPACSFREAFTLDEGSVDPWELWGFLSIGISLTKLDHCVWQMGVNSSFGVCNITIDCEIFSKWSPPRAKYRVRNTRDATRDLDPQGRIKTFSSFATSYR